LNSALYAGLWWLIAQTGADRPLAPSPLDEASRNLDAEAPSAPTPGAYHGVVPGPEARNPLPHPRSDPPRLIWTGFKMVGDRSEIFLQTTRPVEHALAPATGKAAAGSLSFMLRNCRIHMRNNARKIDTRFFASPVQGVSARQRKRDVELNISLKDQAMPEVRVDPGPDGTQFLVLSFPPGGASAGQPEPAARPARAPADLAPPSLSP
jgi:hypothetical protein